MENKKNDEDNDYSKIIIVSLITIGVVAIAFYLYKEKAANDKSIALKEQFKLLEKRHDDIIMDLLILSELKGGLKSNYLKYKSDGFGYFEKPKFKYS